MTKSRVLYNRAPFENLPPQTVPKHTALNVKQGPSVSASTSASASKAKSKKRSSSRHSIEEATAVDGATESTANAAATCTAPIVPAFTRAPVEDRTKYEKLLTLCDDSELDSGSSSEDDCLDHQRDHRSSHAEFGDTVTAATTAAGVKRRPAYRQSINKLTDQDSIGSATDLKDRCEDEDEDVYDGDRRDFDGCRKRDRR